ncbi:hypothetical protein RZS08_33230, partial [Arthrospira platensis SPKY1]|nr:hypothetical protein [Arthrospira platensis SPKY1]
MRKAKFKTLLVAGLSLFVLLLAGLNRAEAQAGLADNFYTVPAGSYVSSAEAEGILMDQITQLMNLLQTLTPGTQPFKATRRAGIF